MKRFVFLKLLIGMISCFFYVSMAESSPLGERLLLEDKVANNGFAILAHKQNYIMPVSYNTRPNQAPWTSFGLGATPVQKAEIKFQISIKAPLAHDLFTSGDALFAAYTQKTFWQAYNKKISSPFRDTSYNPELFYRMTLNQSFLGMDARLFSVGFEHESNGRAEPLSRSWNRIYTKGVVEKGNLMLSLKAWYRIPEKAVFDNNPDIVNYLGYSEIHASYKYEKHTVGVMLRPSFVSGSTLGMQLDWSFPLFKGIQAYVQYYNGYGEGLIDYNHYNNTIGMGIMLNNWF